MKSFKQLLKESYENVPLNESTLGRVTYHANNSNIATLTAFRKDVPLETNIKNNEILRDKIKEAGYGYIHVLGHYIENYGTPTERPVEEHSFLVIGKRGDDNNQLLNDAKKWGEEFNQDSILHKKHNEDVAYFYGTSRRSDSYPGYGKSFSVGKFYPNMAGDFHTILKDRRTFAFAESVEGDTRKKYTFTFQPNYFDAKERVEQLYFSLK